MKSRSIDRSGWPSGQWDNEPDRVEWRTKSGLPGLIVRTERGNLCGYAAVTRASSLHGTSYHDVDAQVHGGLTYSGACRGRICHVPEPGEPDDVWWFGFDCAHYNDLVPKPDYFSDFDGDACVYRSVDYVRAEVESLARQLTERKGSHQ